MHACLGGAGFWAGWAEGVLSVPLGRLSSPLLWGRRMVVLCGIGWCYWAPFLRDGALQHTLHTRDRALSSLPACVILLGVRRFGSFGASWYLHLSHPRLDAAIKRFLRDGAGWCALSRPVPSSRTLRPPSHLATAHARPYRPYTQLSLNMPSMIESS
ncbi:hypothetical protein C8J57DRAFT_1309678 [Mycena rebaudengoi]|nr:hypothetical protein C8J57DRAFT_1309678 [Mycena rebaudengoi]